MVGDGAEGLSLTVLIKWVGQSNIIGQGVLNGLVVYLIRFVTSDRTIHLIE